MLELRQHFPLSGLLRLAELPRSTFYYQQKALNGLAPISRTGYGLISSRFDERRCRVIHRRRGARHADADGG